MAHVSGNCCELRGAKLLGTSSHRRLVTEMRSTPRASSSEPQNVVRNGVLEFASATTSMMYRSWLGVGRRGLGESFVSAKNNG